MAIETNERVEKLVAAWILKQHTDGGDNAHLRECPDAMIQNHFANDGTYGCDTGCDYIRWGGTVACTHGEREEYEDGDFGCLEFIINDLEAMDTTT